MKKIRFISIIMVLILLMTACAPKVTSYEFGPKVDQTAVTQEYKDFLQEKLDNIGKIDKGLTYKCYSVTYDDEGTLIMDGFFINNTGYTVYDIEGLIIVDAPNQMNALLEVARGRFEFPVENFGQLENHQARPWQLTFSEDKVINPNKSATEYTITADLSYKKL